jgi:hypothetical protein
MDGLISCRDFEVGGRVGATHLLFCALPAPGSPLLQVPEFSSCDSDFLSSRTQLRFGGSEIEVVRRRGIPKPIGALLFMPQK